MVVLAGVVMSAEDLRLHAIPAADFGMDWRGFESGFFRLLFSLTITLWQLSIPQVFGGTGRLPRLHSIVRMFNALNDEITYELQDALKAVAKDA